MLSFFVNFFSADHARNMSLSGECGGSIPLYSTVGVVGPSSSREAVMSASILSLFEVPSVGTYATSDELSDSSRFQYFLRYVWMTIRLD